MNDKFLLNGAAQPQSGQGKTADLIKETSTKDFHTDVIEASRDQPILVDFWAPWCGPCRKLTPLIENAVKRANGRVKLVKMNIEDHPAIAGQMGIQSIPAVVAFKDGQPIDGFMGALPESQISEFIERIGGPAGPTPIEAMLEEGKKHLDEKDFSNAAQIFAVILQQEPQNLDAIAGLAECYLGMGETDKAQSILSMAGQETLDKSEHPALKSVYTKIQLLKQSKSLGDTDDMIQALKKSPDNHQIRFNVALVLNGEGDKDGAVEQLLYIIKMDRDWNEGAARTQLLQFFEAWGAKDPHTKTGRRKLSALMFS